MPIDKTYEFKTGHESIPEYNSRIAAYNAAKTAPSSGAPGTTSTTTSGSSPEYFPRYTQNEQAASDYVETFTPPKTAEQIQQDKMRAAQGEVDNLNKLYDSKLEEQRVVNEGRSRGTSSVNTLSGLAGSTEANVQTDKTNSVNKRENDAINNERAVAISGLFSKIRADAVTEAQAQRTEARLSAEAVLAGRKARQEEATKDLTALAQSGVTLEGLKQSDPQSFEYFARNLGGEEQVRAMITLNRPQDQILDKRVENGKYVIAYQNPLTGGIRIESVDLGLPANFSKSIDAGDRILFMPDNWDGDTSKLISISKGLTPSQASSGAAGGTDVDPEQAKNSFALIKSSLTKAKELAGASGRSGARRTAEAWFVGSTDYTNLVAETNTLRTNVLTLATDPTIKKFFGPQMSNADVQLMTSAGTTLNPELQSPGNMNAELIRLEDLVKRMEASIPQSQSTQSGSRMLVKDGQSFDASGLTLEEYQQAINDGYTPQ